MNKRFLRLCAAFTAAAMLLCVTACGSRQTYKTEGRLSVVCTVFPQYDFVRNIVGDKADVTLLVKPGAEVHGFEPTLEDVARIQQSDLFIYVSDFGETWIPDALGSMGDSAPRSLALVDMVSTVEEELTEGMEEEDEEDEGGEPELDEHVWTSPKNAAAITEALCGELSALDPDNADTYRANADSYMEKLDRLDALFAEAVSSGSRTTVVFAERFPFRYLADEYGLDAYAAFPGCSSSTEPSLATISFLVNKVEDENIPVIFYIEFSKQTVSDTIAQATGAKPMLFHSCHNLTAEEFAAGEDYISLMTRNAANLKEALA